MRVKDSFDDEPAKPPMAEPEDGDKTSFQWRRKDKQSSAKSLR
jgi:hypothetical protein